MENFKKNQKIIIIITIIIIAILGFMVESHI